MGSVELNNFQEVVTLSSLAMDATVKWDDVTEKLEDNPGLVTVLEISQEELGQATRVLRKVMNKAHDRMNDLKRGLEQALRPTPAPVDAGRLDMMWEAAQAAHPGPRVQESVLLPGPEGRDEEVTSAPAVVS